MEAVVSGERLQRHMRLRALLRTLVVALLVLVWALPQDPELTRRVLGATGLGTLLAGVTSEHGATGERALLLVEPKPGFRLDAESRSLLSAALGGGLRWPVLLIHVGDCGGCSEIAPLRPSHLDGWPGGSVVAVASKGVGLEEVRGLVGDGPVVVIEPVPSYDRRSIAYQLGTHFAPRGYVMAEGWTLVRAQRQDQTVAQFVHAISTSIIGEKTP